MSIMIIHTCYRAGGAMITVSVNFPSLSEETSKRNCFAKLHKSSQRSTFIGMLFTWHYYSSARDVRMLCLPNGGHALEAERERERKRI